MKYLNNTFIVLIILFILAFLPRVFQITEDPPSLNWDEASLGYNAYSILMTGKDEWGRTMPLSFEAFGDFKLPGYIYTLVPFIAIFGLNEFSVRLPSVFFGSLSVVLLYLIVFEVFKKRNLAFISALLLVISPWHFFLSRIALEANLALFFFIVGLYLLLLGYKKAIFLIPSSLFLGLSVFTYNSARVFVPLFLFSVAIYYRKKIKVNRILIISSIIFSIFLAAGFYLALFQDSSARYYWVKILDEGAINFLEQTRNNSTLNPILTNLIYNRYTYFITNFVLNYLKHFSVQFLVLTGGDNYQFSIQGMGQIYFIELPFLIYGFYKLLKEKAGKIFLFWLILAPIPSALTREAPHALRSIFMIGSIQVITAFGFFAVLNLVKKRFWKNFIIALFAILITTNAILYFKTYFNDYRLEYSKAWQYGYKQVMETVAQNYNTYPKIFISKNYGEPHLFYLFFSEYDPSKYQNSDTLVRYEKTNWRWVDKLDKIYFINDWEMRDKLNGESDALVITTPGNYPENAEKLETIYFLDGSKAFDIVKI